MSHEIDMTNNRANMAYVGDTPWHGLGQQLQPGQTIEEWATAAGMNFTLKESPASFLTPGHARTRRTYPGQKILFRDDTCDPLGLVSDRYKIVQPIEVLEFFRDLVGAGGFSLDTAGCLYNGSQFWALANIGVSANILGHDEDKVNGYVLLASSCDGSMATTGMFTSIRVVCNNTLSWSVQEGESGKTKRYIKVPHSRTFHPEEMKAELGLANEGFAKFTEKADRMARHRVKDKQAMEWLLRVWGELSEEEEVSPESLEVKQAKHVESCLRMFKEEGRGSQLETAKGTVWGLLNGVTEYIDMKRTTRTPDARLNQAWFGEMARVKNRAWDLADKMVA